MPVWIVEVDYDLIDEVGRWSESRRLELFAIQQRLERGGPESLGLIKAELEGVPPWRDLATPVSLLLPVDLPSGLRVLTLEVQPNFRIVIVRLESTEREGRGDFLTERKSRVWKSELTAEQRAQVDALDAEIGRRVSTLQTLRNAIGLSQAELADILQTTQSNVSKMESGRETKLTTLRKLVEAKGGRLTLHAEFKDRDLVLPL